MSTQRSKMPLILDTSPLITLCAFQAAGQLVVDHILPIAETCVVETVVAEAIANPAHPDVVAIKSLVDAGRITHRTTPTTPVDALIDGYTKLGRGERDTLRLGTTMPDTKIVLDDYLAFVIAARFGLGPILLLDLRVVLVREYGLDKKIAREIVEKTAKRYSTPLVEHTGHKLNQV